MIAVTLASESEEDWVEVRRYSRAADARDGALVLASAGISSQLLQTGQDYRLIVSAELEGRARRELTQFLHENRVRPPEPTPTWRPQQLTAAMLYMAVMVVVFVLSRKTWPVADWQDAGAAIAGRITSGEWWRTVTALTLHGDLGHIASNVVAGGFVGILLSQTLGIGLAWLAILLSGIIGNFLNAFLHAPGYTAIGASTAVFGGLGILAALAWRQRASLGRGWRVWAPLAAGAMLLAFLGLGEGHIDIGGHILGFVAGIAIGAVLHITSPGQPGQARRQALFGATSLALIVVSWIAALAAD